MKILLTGSTGYIGKRLLPILIEKGHEVVCLIRDPRRFQSEVSSKKITLIKGDLLNSKSLKNIPDDIDSAYYLAHSMGTADKDFAVLESNAVENFIARIDQTKTKQIIFLSGIINPNEELSKHLKSRKNVEDILNKAKAHTTILRAAIIIGSGSASFEIIRDLAEKLPVMITPKWLKTRCQPISIKNVLDYLLGVLLNKKTFNKTFDIGGPDVLSYKKMLEIYAEIRGLKRYIFTVPVLTPRLSSYWLYFVTSTNFSLAKSLVESMKNEVICLNNDINKIVATNMISYKDAIERAFKMIDANNVASSWIDAANTGNISQDFLDKVEVPQFGCLVDERNFSFSSMAAKVKDKVWNIGGENGWYFWNWTWYIRGFIDKIFGGVGLRRGRRNPTELKPGDALDFWRVISANKDRGKLILYAEMKLPGEAWLEFDICEKQNRFIQRATFRPSGLLGRIYWYTLLPIHNLIFNGMAKKIIM